MNDIEEVDLDLGELDFISNSKWQKAPMVYIEKTGRRMGFNRAAEKLINFRWFTISFNDTYIVFTPPNGMSGNAYRITQRSGKGLVCASAVALTNEMSQIKGKHFKLYKSGNRFCIKRNEPMEG